MSFITRGFGGRRRERDPRLPPGQSSVSDWPVLSAGPTPRLAPDAWEFAIGTENGVHRWDRAELQALGMEDIVVDIHCVTHWTKLDMPWRGVSLDRIFAEVQTDHRFATAHSFGGYTTNLALDDMLGGKSWIAFEADGEPLSAEHGGPARLLVPHLYFWKSAKWVQGLITMPHDKPGFWEQNGYHPRGDPWREERYG